VSESASISSSIAKGAAVNAVGLVTRAIGTPLLYILLTRLFGSAPLGLFLIAYNLMEIMGALSTSGFVDGGILYASRFAHRDEDRERLYGTLRSIFLLTIGVGFFLLGFILLLAPWLVSRFYPQHPGLVPVLQILAFTLPFESLSRVAVSIPKAHLKMGPEVLVFNIMAPIMTMALALAFWLLDWGAPGISMAFVLTYVGTLGLAVWQLKKFMDVKPLFRFSGRKEKLGELLGFVIPQNLNMALNRFISSMDVIMLAGFGASPGQIAFYGLGAQIVRNVRQVKIVFSNSYNPVIARYFHERRLGELNATLGTVSAWSIALGMPALFVVAFYRHDLLLLFDPAFVDDPTFMLLLLVNPFLSCSVGMAGNALVMAGLSRWNLFNSVLVGGLNFGFNWLMIPRYGLFGAALATAMAGTIVSALQVIEVNRLIRVRLPWRYILPWILLGLALFAWPFFTPFVQASLWLKLVTGAAMLGIYSLIYFKGSSRVRRLFGT